MSSKPKPERQAVFLPEFRADLSFFIDTDRKLALRLMRLVEQTLHDPFDGIGKPEPLRGNWSGYLESPH